jgi:hypothetical protein
MINRRSQQSKGLIGVYLVLVLSACTAINIHQEPPSDWPKLETTTHKVGFWEMQRHCGTSGLKFLLTQSLACAWIDFNTMTCRIYYAADDEHSAAHAIEHEKDHCEGRDHIGSTHLRDGWENWKRGQVTANK